MRFGIVIVVALMCLAAGPETPDPLRPADVAPQCRQRKPFSLGGSKLVLDDQYLCMDDQQLREILRAEKQEDYDQVSALLDEGCETLGEPMKASALDAEGQIVRVRLYGKPGESMIAFTTKAAVIDAGDLDVDTDLADPRYAKEVPLEDARTIRTTCARWMKTADQSCCVLHETRAAVFLRETVSLFASGEAPDAVKTRNAVDSCLAAWNGQFMKAKACYEARPK